MRAGTKFRGLINVSGFHVDPGYKGKLLFAVFNAGPISVHLKQGDPCFLIWYADLNDKSQKVKSGVQLTALPAERINAISGELHSFEGMSKRIATLERESHFYKIVATIVLGLAVTYVGTLIKDCRRDTSGTGQNGAPAQGQLQSSSSQPAAERAPPPVPSTRP